jgi:HlyD family secretion protein
VAEADAETAEANAEAARAAVAAANGAVQQAVASLHQAGVNLAYTAIVSPTSGTVISRNVDVGQTVAASLQAPTLFVIAEDLKRMQVDTSVAEADVGKLRDGMDATFTVDAYPGEKFRGRVRQIRNSPQTVQNVVTYDAVIDVENPELKLRPGMTANVTFVWADEEDVLRVPNAALRFRPPPGALPLPPSGPRSGAGGGQRVAGSNRPPSAGGNRAANGFRAGATPVAENNGAPGARPAGDGAGGDRDSPGRRMLWLLRQGKPVPVLVRTGISDGTLTEVLEGDLAPGDACIVDMDLGKRGSGGPAGGPPGGMRRMF